MIILTNFANSKFKQLLMDTLEYNSTREPLKIPEYGRNIQKMVECCIATKDRAERTRMAYLTVEAMALLHNITTDNNAEVLHTLWDHLFIISDFNLDVDAPFPVPEEKSLLFHPIKPEYNIDKSEIGNKYRNYGSNIKSLIQEACKITSAEEQKKAALVLANHMKKSYIAWNKDIIPDEVILEHLRLFSKGKMEIESGTVLMDVNAIVSLNNKSENGIKQNNGSKQNNNAKQQNNPKQRNNGKQLNNNQKNNNSADGQRGGQKKKKKSNGGKQ
jgi:phage baseplate assembly protein W